MLKKILISIVILLLVGLGIWKIFFSGDTISDKIEDVSKNLNSYKPSMFGLYKKVNPQ